ncbi:MAG: hypothetical protein E2O88_09975 [Bacteroidetes bacterium]|nr:MAG: hypothetical protein E2O88_09975 [Bacteroidota bacterium]
MAITFKSLLVRFSAFNIWCRIVLLLLEKTIGSTYPGHSVYSASISAILPFNAILWDLTLSLAALLTSSLFATCLLAHERFLLDIHWKFAAGNFENAQSVDYDDSKKAKSTFVFKDYD